MRYPALESSLPKMLIEQFGSAWLSFKTMDVYICISHRYINDVYILCVQIINIETKNQRKGLFTQMVTKIRSMTGLPLFLENTRQDFAESLIARHNWTIVRKDIQGRYNLILDI